MELKLVMGRAGTGKTAHCLQALRERLAAAPEGPPLVWLLPEHATFKAERLLADTPGLGGFSRAHVFGFRRLARRVFIEAGGAQIPRVSEIGKRLLLGNLLRARQGEMKVLGRAARQRNFTEVLAALIEEFKSYGVDAPRLAEASGQFPDTPLGEKLGDLALLYAAFGEAMRGRYTDAEDAMDALASRAADSPLLRGAEIWVDGFVFFNPQELAALRAMVAAARSVTVTLCIDEPDNLAHGRETAVFHRQWQTRRKLYALAESLGVAVTETVLETPRRFETAALATVERRMFAFPARASDDAKGLTLAMAANARAEIEGVAADIRRLCREESYRWRDIGVLARDGEAYLDLIETVFESYGIPYFSDNSRCGAHHPLAELLRSALEAVRGWKYEPLFRCFKTDFFPVTREQVDLLENYALEFGLRGSRWTMAEDWTYLRRLSLDEDSAPDEAAAERLAEINAIRRLAVAPLLRFAAAFGKDKTARSRTEALYALLVELDAPARLEVWAAEAERRGALAEARAHRQIWDGVIELLEQIVQICGDTHTDGEEYAAMVETGLESLAVRLIPPGLDYVTIAPFDQNSLDNVPALYIVGAAEGVMPRRARAEGLLTDGDRLRLLELGVELSPGAGADNFAERFQIYAALTRARRTLWLSCPLADGDGGAVAPSPLLGRLRDLLPSVRALALAPEPPPGDEALYLSEPSQALARLAGALREYRKTGELPSVWRAVYNWALADAPSSARLGVALAGILRRAGVEPLPEDLAGRLYAKRRRLRGSVTRFEQFHACPFRHFARYGLALKERAEFRFAAPDLGQFLHAALKMFGDRMAGEARRWGSVGDAEYPGICADIVEALAPKLQNEILLSTAQYRHLLGRIRRTIERSICRLIAFDRASAFHPVGCEVSFGARGAALQALAYPLENGYRLEIGGQIDRIDCADGLPYFLVIDYKTGRADLNLTEVLYGLQLQLLTYLLVARAAATSFVGASPLPAGVLYCFLRSPVLVEKRRLTEAEARQKLDALLRMPGWLLADVDVVRLIDKTAKFVKVAVTAKNAIHGGSRHSVKTQEEFAVLLDTVDRLLADTGRRILAGEIAKTPFELGERQACAYCPYGAVCRFDRRLPECASRKLEPLDPDAAMRMLTEEASLWLGRKNN